MNWFSCFANFRIFNVELVISTDFLFYLSLAMALISVAMSFMRAYNLIMKIYRLKCMTASRGRCTFWKRFNPIYFRETPRKHSDDDKQWPFNCCYLSYVYWLNTIACRQNSAFVCVSRGMCKNVFRQSFDIVYVYLCNLPWILRVFTVIEIMMWVYTFKWKLLVWKQRELWKIAKICV